MKTVMWLMILILSFSVVTAAEPVYNYRSLTLVEEITNDVVILPTRSDYEIEYFDLTLHLFPSSSYRQTILDQDLSPETTTNTFRWEDPSERLLRLETSFEVKTSADYVPVRKKVDFPLTNIPRDIEDFVEITESIDTNADIRELAQTLAQGVDDLFILEHKLARWVNQNIAYNLSTITADANYPASWVLETGYGVCDELTNLFIALNRALGVPARFVSGIAYSDSILFDEKWGNHGWAEVYFPGYGWVPYDVTYQEYGHIDATHIEFEKAVDGSSPSVEYKTRGLYYSFEPAALDFTTNIIGYGDLREPHTELSITVQEPSIQFGSYNLFILDIENLRDYYIVEDVTLAKALEIEYFDPLRQSIVLAPKEKKKVYWLIKVDDSLDTNFIYSFPMSVFGSSGSEAETIFSVLERAEHFDRNYMEQFKEEETVATVSTSLDCQFKESYHKDEEAQIDCQGTEVLQQICYEGECESQTSQATFALDTQETGIKTAIILTQTSEGEKKHFFTYRVADKPLLYIQNISITQDVDFKGFATLSVLIKKNSSSDPQNVTISLTHDMLEKEWYFSFLDKDKQFDIELPGQGYVRGVNEFTIDVSFFDDEGREYYVEATTTGTLSELSASEKTLIFYNTYASKVIRKITDHGVERYYAELLAPALIMIAFFIVIGLLKKLVFRMIGHQPPLKEP